MKKLLIFALILLSKISFGQSITLDPKTTTQANFLLKGDMAMQKITPITATGTQSAVNRNGASIIKFTNGGVVTGIAEGYNGLLVYLMGGGGGPWTIAHQSLTETAPENRIITNTALDIVSNSGLGGVLLLYDSSVNRWRVMEIGGLAAASGWGLAGNALTTLSNYIGTTDAKDFRIKTNGIERVNVTSGGVIGVGLSTPNPNSMLHILKSDSPSIFPNSLGSTAIIESDNHTSLYLYSPSNKTSTLYLGGYVSNFNNGDGFIRFDNTLKTLDINGGNIISRGNDDGSFEGGYVKIYEDLIIKRGLVLPLNKFSITSSSVVSFNRYDGVPATVNHIDLTSNTTIHGINYCLQEGIYLIITNNDPTYSLTFKHLSATGIAGEKIRCLGGLDTVLPPGGSITLISDIQTASPEVLCWQVVSVCK